MILLCGIPSESSLRRVRERLEELGTPLLMLNQRRVAEVDAAFSVDDGQVRGVLRYGDSVYPLEGFAGVLIRMMDDRFLPEIRDEPDPSDARAHSRQVHDTLWQWCEVASARVLNRPSSMASNGSKPYQGQLIAACGLGVPDTLVTNDPDLVRAFRRRHGRIVYKSVSGARSIVQRFEDSDDARLDDVRWCPVQFQELVEGDDVRVHVVGDEVFATRIVSDFSDYRYASRLTGVDPELTPTQLPGHLADRCVALAHALGLPLAGIDLRITPEGRVVCFEVNPSPAYSYYEAHTGQPIAATIARFLTAAIEGRG